MSWKPRIASAGLLLACALLTASLASLAIAPPLVIDGNEEMARLEGLTGLGTPEQPYVLDGLLIERRDPSAGVILRNISNPTILRNLAFVGCEEEAIRIEGCSNIWIIECAFEGNAVGVVATDDCSDIVLTLNAFRGNSTDVAATVGTVDIDDDHVGNWWDRYEGIDANGDGIGSRPHLLSTPLGQLSDDYPLIHPYDGDPSSVPAGQFRLETRLTLGEVQSYATIVETSIEVSTPNSDSISSITLHGTSRSEVLSAPGTGFYEMRTSLVDPQVEVITDGETMQPAQSSGSVERSLIHRFGGGGDNVSTPSSQPAAAPAGYAGAPLPVRPIPIEHTWTDAFEQGPEHIGAERGRVLSRVEYRLDRLEDVNGRTCAVLVSTTETTIRAESDHPTLGLLTYRGGGVTVVKSWLPLDGGLTLRTIQESEMSIRTYIDGDQTGATSTVMSIRMESPGLRSTATSVP